MSFRGVVRVANPPNPWHATSVEWLGEPPAAQPEVFEDRTLNALSRNDSPDLPFRWSVNPYRGCWHGCAYCYARPSHQYLDLGAGTDFERKLVVKPRVAEGLRRAFDKPRWRGDLVVFSGNTDCYQPLEASWRLTRACLEVCAAYRNPVMVVTKSALVERDVDVLAELARARAAAVMVSIPFLDETTCRAVEPGAPAPARRLRTVARLAKAGIPVGVFVAPVIPGLSDGDAPRVLAEARAAGARYASWTLLRLPGPVEQVFVDRMRRMLPARLGRVLSQTRACRDGKLDDCRFGARMGGRGPRWEAIAALLERQRARLGMGPPPGQPDPTPFRRPGELPLWE